MDSRSMYVSTAAPALFPTSVYCPFKAEGCKMKWPNQPPTASVSHSDKGSLHCVTLARRRVHKHLQAFHTHESFQINLLISPSGDSFSLMCSEIGTCPDCQLEVFTLSGELTRAGKRRLEWEMNLHRREKCQMLGTFIERYGEYVRECTPRTIIGPLHAVPRLRKRHMESASSPEPMSPSDNTETDSESQDGTAVSCAEKNLTALESAYSGEQDGPAVSYGRKPSKGRESGKDSEVYSKRMGEEITQTESSPNIKLPVQSLKMASEPKLLSKIDPEVPLETLEGPSRSRSWATLDPAEITATGPGRWGVVRTTKTQSEPTPPARVLPFEKTKLPNVNLPKHQAILDDLREQNQNSEMKGVNITDEGDGWLAKILN